MRFSQRVGKQPIRTEIQLDSIDDALRTQLWNLFHMVYVDEIMEEANRTFTARVDELVRFKRFFHSLWHHFFKWPLDTIPQFADSAIGQIRDWYGKAEWYEVYDFIEFVSLADRFATADEFRRACNDVFEKQNAGYRFIDGRLAPITDEIQLKTIEQTIANSRKGALSGASKHLESALEKFSDRKTPDYRNSIKESISAVESVCRTIAGNSATLGQSLKPVAAKLGLHPAQEKAFSALYGWTSDAGGIRHALEDGVDPPDADDARYMLVSCSAFVSYLAGKAARAGIKLR